MKKLLCTFLVLLLTLSLIACNAGNGTETSGTPSGTSGDDTPAETLAKVADTETPWHIEAWETNRPIEVPDIPQEKQNLALKTPLEFETEQEDVQISVDFFQEYYLIGEPIQIKLTVTYTGDQEITVEPAPAYFTNSSMRLWRETDYLPTEHEDKYYCAITYMLAESIPPFTLDAQNNSLTYEYLYIGDPAFFSLTEVYSLHISLKNSDDLDIIFEIPLEVVEVERVEESESSDTSSGQGTSKELAMLGSGVFEGVDNGISFRADFFDSAYKDGSSPIEGTLTLTNRTDSAVSFSLRALVTDSYLPERAAYEISSSADKIAVSDGYETVTSEEPMTITLDAGASVTVNLSVEVPDGAFVNDTLHFLSFMLYDSADGSETVLHRFYIRVT